MQYAQEIPNVTDENKNAFSSLKKSLVREDFDRLTRELLEISPNHILSEDNIQLELHETIES